MKINSKIVVYIIFLNIIVNTYAQTYHVGNINISADVGNMGNAIATLPIKCSPGRLNNTPQITLNYNSNYQGDFMGKGWSFSAVSTISRSGTNYHINNGRQESIKFNADDIFRLDGQKLLLTSGNYGSNNSTYQTEQDMFAKVTYNNNSFTVDLKNGGKLFYGNTTNSRQYPVNNNTDVLHWYLTKAYDNNGNYTEYVYDVIDNQTLLIEIKYTGFDCTFNGTSSCNEQTETTFNKIVFSYIDKNNSQSDYEKRFIYGNTFTQKKLLDKITCYSGNDIVHLYEFTYAQDPVNVVLTKIEEKNGSNESLIPVNIEWMDEGVFYRKEDINNKHVNDIQLTGDFNGDGKTDIILFNYISDFPNSYTIKNYKGFKVFSLTTENNRTFYKLIHNNPTMEFNYVSSILVADINIDGKDDIILQFTNVNHTHTCNNYKHYNYHEFAYNALISNTNNNLNFNYMIDVYPKRQHHKNGYYNFKEEDMYNMLTVKPFIADFDGDGEPDLLERILVRETLSSSWDWCGGNLHYRNIGNPKDEWISLYLSTKKHLTNINDRYIESHQLPYIEHYIPMDYNGNGKLDIMCSYEWNDQTEVFEYNNSTNSFSVVYNGGFPTKYHKEIKTGDFNGDGNTDLLYYVNNTWMIAYSKGKNEHFDEHDATNNWFNHSYYFTSGSSRIEFSIADLNGDGKSDIVERLYISGSDNNIYAYFSTGSGFEKVYCEHNVIENNYPIRFDKILTGDFDGDGRQDFTVIGTGILNLNAPFVYEQFNQFKPNLKKIKTTNNHEIEFVFNSIPKSLHFKKTNLTQGGSNTANVNLLFNAKNIVIPINIVEKLIVKSGTITNEKLFYYNNLLFHVHGRGIMGFYKTAVVNNHTNNQKRTTIINQFSQNVEFNYLLNLTSASTYQTSTPDGQGFVNGSNELTRTQYTYKQIRTTPQNRNVFFMYNNNSSVTN